MGKSGVEIKLVYNRLPAIAKQLPVEAWQAVRISAAEVMAKAKEKMKEASTGAVTNGAGRCTRQVRRVRRRQLTRVIW